MMEMINFSKHYRQITGYLYSLQATLNLDTVAFEDYKEKADKKIYILATLLEKEMACKNELEERIKFLEEDLGVELDEQDPLKEGEDVNNEGEQERGAENGSNGVNNTNMEGWDIEMDDEARRENEAALCAEQVKVHTHSKPLKNLLKISLLHLMGLSTLVPRHMPTYPYMMDWPKDPLTQKPLLQFDWDKKFDAKVNTDGVKDVLTYMRTYGVTKVPLVKADSLDEEDSGIVRATHNSRAKAVLDSHIRERANSQYKDSKYDSTFILNAMSDYEDNPRQDDKKPTVYLRCPPDYCSDLDGSAKEDTKPPRARDLTNRIHTWQVKPEVLEKNPGWFDGTYPQVAKSGIAWGNTEDPHPGKKAQK
ncbi:hypothetical protein BDQ17DRAFT_1414909 [Cyathus striatus]|nr:hypothetical protein BDQ17DRAFT_1414909 [Cyathus striatus]